jgi:hypothetical protein
MLTETNDTFLENRIGLDIKSPANRLQNISQCFCASAALRNSQMTIFCTIKSVEQIRLPGQLVWVCIIL